MSNIDWMNILTKVGIVIVIIIVTWVIAWVVKWALTKLVSKISFLNKGEGEDANSAGKGIGQIGSLIVWLFGLVAILQVFSLENVLTPIKELLATIMGYLPNIVAAGVVFFIGYLLAKIVKQLIEAGFGAINVSAVTNRLKKVDPTAANADGGDDPAAVEDAATAEPKGGFNAKTIGSILGNVMFAIILITVGIVALQILNISVISDPAEKMLTIILNAIPSIIAAGIMLGIGYAIARFIGGMLENALRSIGLDNGARKLGVLGEDQSAALILTRIAQVAIVVFFAITAANLLGFAQITTVLNTILALGGSVVFGGVIIAAGFLIAKIVGNIIGSGTVSTVIRYAIIVLFAAMGLQYMGIANTIVTLAFGAAVIGGALAAALAFGIGGRHAAAKVLDKTVDEQVTPKI